MRGTSFPQAMVDQTPAYEKKKKKVVRENQVLSRKSGIIRPDMRKKVKYL